ncbi:MAG: VOC family protein [bacterium]
MIDLGRFELCLNVNDVHRSIDFYTKLGFRLISGDPGSGWAVMEYGNLKLALYQGHIAQNMLNFRGGDVSAIAARLKDKGMQLKSDAMSEKDGSMGAIIEDPDGNVIYFNTHPDEAK